MKLLLTADWHVGVRGDSEIYHKIFTDFITSFLIPTILKEDVKAVCILGDFYDNRNAVNTKSDNLGIMAIEEILHQTEAIIYMILGNHDIYFKNTRDINSLKKFEKYDRVKIINETSLIRFENRDVVFVPWVLEHEVESVFNMKGDICLGHFPFSGYEMVRGIVENKGYSIEDLKKNFLKVFSGHFHLGNDVYVGNPFQMSWADTEEEKGVVILDTDTLNTKFVVNDISPIYKKVYLSQLKNKSISMDIMKNNFIKLFLDDKYTDKLLEKLQEVIRSKSPLSFIIEGLSEDEVDMDVEVKDLKNPIESLMDWVGNIELKGNIDRDTLLKKINTLYTNSI